MLCATSHIPNSRSSEKQLPVEKLSFDIILKSLCHSLVFLTCSFSSVWVLLATFQELLQFFPYFLHVTLYHLETRGGDHVVKIIHFLMLRIYGSFHLQQRSSSIIYSYHSFRLCIWIVVPLKAQLFCSTLKIGQV